MEKTLAIIGGGASGLMCAVTAARRAAHEGKNIHITVYERNPRVGKKLLATGNGKCNLTNTDENINAYHSNDMQTLKSILDKFGAQQIISFFEELGVVCVSASKTGIYPRSMQAASVLDALRFEAQKLGVEFICGANVGRIEQKNGKYVLFYGKSSFCADMAVIASGSEASGGSGSGLTLLKNLGHKIYAPYPALTAIKCDSSIIKTAKGMRANAHISLTADGKNIASEFGEVLFCDYGISGIAAMQLSGAVSKLFSDGRKHSITLSLDLAHEYSENELYAYLTERRNRLAHLELENFLVGFINKRVAMAAVKSAGIGGFNTPSGELSNNSIMRLTQTLKSFKLTVTGTKGAPDAQVMGGGASLAEFDDKTLESKKHSGLYACGEALDCYGDCGGYNLTWAWASGFVCGNDAAKKI